MESVTQVSFQDWSTFSQFFYFDTALLSDPEIVFRLVLQVLLLAGSAFFSGSETALFSLSRLDLKQLRRERHPQSATLHALLDQPRRLIISILCGNELINIAAVANMTAILFTLYGEERAGIISIVVMVPLLLLLGEITPKTIALSNPVRVSSRIIAAPMNLWVKFVTPLRWVIRGVADRVTGWLVGEEKAPENLLQLDEFRSIVDEVANEGELRDTERTLIYHLLDAGATEIVEIMTPRTQVAFIDADMSVTDMVERFRTIRHARVPVFQNQHDNLVGMLHIEHVLPLVLDKTDLSKLSAEQLIRPPIVVPPTKKVNEMFEFFQNHDARAAIVLNEFGGVEGLITMRDVLTFIFGHLSGEIEGQTLYQERDENVYEVPGNMRLTDFNHLTNFGIEDPRMTTIGGVAFRYLDRIPREGDKVKVEGYEMKVLEVNEQRIVRLRVSRGETQNGTEATSENSATGRSNDQGANAATSATNTIKADQPRE